MKKFFAKNSGRLLGLAAMALVALAAPAAQAVIVPASPVGQWDCVINGPGQAGIIFLNFTEDVDTNSGFPTFEGLFVQAGHQGPAPSSSRGGGSTGRGGSGGSSFTNIFGAGFIEGSSGPVADNGGVNDWLGDSRGRRGNWFFNSKGQVVGSYFTVLNVTGTATNFFETCAHTNFGIPLTNGGTFPFSYDICFTNAVLTTNVTWGPAADGENGATNLTFVNTNFTLGDVGLTNNVSFVGKVVLGKRITLAGTSAYGKFTITGVPLAPISTALPVDGSYFWTGIETQNGTKFAEVFNLVNIGIPNAYAMFGHGPSYSYGSTNAMSLCLISANKKIGFAVTEIPFNGTDQNSLSVTRTTVGKFSNNVGSPGTELEFAL